MGAFMGYEIEKNDERKSVLIIDDEPDIIEIIEMKLSKYNVKIVTASDGFNALFKVDNQSFELILTDLKMPGRDGLFVLEHIRKSKLNKSSPVVAISGFIGTEEIKKLSANRVSGVIVKPIVGDNFDKIVSKFLELKEA
jgi:two-component system, NtrC family, response regulator PilR